MVGFCKLIRRAQADETHAQEVLLTLLRPFLDRVARAHSGPIDVGRSAADLVQETLVRVWRNLDQFEAGPDDRQTWQRFLGWLKQIVVRLELNAHRDSTAQRRHPPGVVVSLHKAGVERSSPGTALDPPGPVRTPSSFFRLTEKTQGIHKALDDLPDPLDATILRLRFFEDVSLRQVARDINLSYDEVRQRYHSSIRHLYRVLAAYRD